MTKHTDRVESAANESNNDVLGLQPDTQGEDGIPTLSTPLTVLPLAAFAFCQAMGMPSKGGQPPLPRRNTKRAFTEAAIASAGASYAEILAATHRGPNEAT
ncbi:hypothetical protein [Mycetocola saprophilus]|uniref:hypothetical protein n=1 Tax=Mycetocola saprophilus TaxID=76636 RepID=UPI0012DF8869|nr:hypothetical protein [Mycetocola saprophilus]